MMDFWKFVIPKAALLITLAPLCQNFEIRGSAPKLILNEPV